MTTSLSKGRTGTSGDVWEKAARAGYIVSGVLHLLLGFAIVRIGLGSGGEADQSNALASVGHQPLGAALLWIAAAALVALAFWQFADALRGHDAGDRAKAAGKGVVYVALAFTAGSVAMGSGSDGDQQAQGVAARLMEAPAGRILVGAVGLGILAAGIYHVYKGATQRFMRDLRRSSNAEVSRGVRWLGMVGYPAKGFALGTVGVLFTYAAITADAEKAKGIDGAVESLLGIPAGGLIVILVGIGFAAYGLYSFGRARYQRM